MLEAAASTPSYAEPCASSVRPTTYPFGAFLEGVFGGNMAVAMDITIVVA